MITLNMISRLPLRDGCSCVVVENENGAGVAVVKSDIFGKGGIFNGEGTSNAGRRKNKGSDSGGGICIGKGGKK